MIKVINNEVRLIINGKVVAKITDFTMVNVTKMYCLSWEDKDKYHNFPDKKFHLTYSEFFKRYEDAVKFLKEIEKLYNQE